MNDDRPFFFRSPTALFGLGALVFVVVTDVVLRHTASSPADFTLFLGRFHPLAVHLPIGVVLLVATAELATLWPKLKPRIDPVLGLVLPVLVAVTAGAFLLGQLLARSGDFAPRLLTLHRRSELFASVGVCLTPLLWAFQEQRGTKAARWAYRGLLGASVAVLSLGAHFGGSLTHGDTYLTRYAPGPLQGLLGGRSVKPTASASAEPPAQEPRVFHDVLAPLFAERCVSCHGPEKVKAGLKLDSLAAILKGGENGPVVTPGKPDDSELLRRLLLPANDDDHMPPEDKPGLNAAQVALVRFWIERGANDELRVRDLLLPPEARPALEGHGASQTPTSVAPSAAPHGSAAPHESASPSAPAPPGAPARPPSAPPAAAAQPSAHDAGSPPGGASPSSPAAAAPAPSPSGGASATAILAEKCEKCHGAAKQKNQLRVDSLSALLRGGKSGPAVVPGDPQGSALIRRLLAPLDDDEHMPPKKEVQLDAAEIRTLSAFVQHMSPSAVARASETTATPPAAGTARSSTSKSEPSEAAPLEASAPGARPGPPPATTTSAASTSPAPPEQPANAELLTELPASVAVYPTAIAPLLHSHCARCHTGAKAAGGLSIEPYAALLRGGDTGPAVTPGKPDASVLVTRVSAPLDDGDHMPPEGEPQLRPDDVALITAWVANGAPESTATETAALPSAALRALASPADAAAQPGGEVPANGAGAAPASVVAAAPQGRSGGCAACVVAADTDVQAARWLVFALPVALALRRRARRTAR